MRGRRVLVAVGVTDVGQFVIRELALAALVVSEEGAGESDALDDVVGEGEGFKMTLRVESEEAFLAWRGSGTGDNVVVTEGETGVGGIHPDDTASGIVDEVVVKVGRTFGRGLTEFGDEIATVFL